MQEPFVPRSHFGPEKEDEEERTYLTLHEAVILDGGMECLLNSQYQNIFCPPFVYLGMQHTRTHEGLLRSP